MQTLQGDLEQSLELRPAVDGLAGRLDERQTWGEIAGLEMGLEYGRRHAPAVTLRFEGLFCHLHDLLAIEFGAGFEDVVVEAATEYEAATSVEWVRARRPAPSENDDYDLFGSENAGGQSVEDFAGSNQPQIAENDLHRERIEVVAASIERVDETANWEVVVAKQRVIEPQAVVEDEIELKGGKGWSGHDQYEQKAGEQRSRELLKKQTYVVV